MMRFVRMLSLVMSDQLRTAVLHGVDAYRNFWERYDFNPSDLAGMAGFPDVEVSEHLLKASHGQADQIIP